ncbi:MAG: hypothetical protein ABIG11_02645 [bacterium]
MKLLTPASIPPRWLLLLIVLVYGGLFWLSVRNPSNAVKNDSAEYLKLAYNLRNHQTFSSGDAAPFAPELFRLPGYPFFLALINTTSPSALQPAIGIQCLLGMLLPFLVWPLFCEAGGRRGAILAMIFLFLDLVVVMHQGLILAEALFACMLTFALWRSIAYFRTSSARNAILAGFFWGLAALIKPIALYAAWPLSVSSLKQWKKALLIGVIAAALPSLWIFRNWALTGHAVYTIQGGLALFYSAAHVLAMDSDQTEKDAIREMEASLQQNVFSEAADPFGRSETVQKKAIAIMTERPAATLKYCLSGAARILGGTGLEMIVELAKTEGPAVGSDGSKTQITGQGTLHLLRRYPALIPLQAAYMLFLAGGYFFFALGIVRLIRTGQTPVAVFLVLSVTAFLLIASHQGYYRFRIPLVPFLAFGIAAAFRPSHNSKI